MASAGANELAHDEVWDDSALVDSWNEAFEEYKKYHSLAAKGEKVDISQPKPGPTKTNGEQQPPSLAPVNFVPPPAPEASTGATVSAPPGLANIPQTLLGSTQHEGLKNIMMSWYYAGYYTGLYEGQQKAWATMQAAQEGD